MQSKAIGIPTYIPKSNGPRAYPRNSVEGLNPVSFNDFIELFEFQVPFLTFFKKKFSVNFMRINIMYMYMTHMKNSLML